MTFPVVESVTETSFTANTTDHLCNLPATVGAGNLLLLIFANDGLTVQTTPSGWTALDKQTQGNQVYGGIYALDATGTEGGTQVNVITAIAEAGTAQIYRISGWGGTLSQDVDISTVAVGTSSTPNSTSVTDGWGGGDNLFLAVVCSGDDDETVNNAPTNYTNLIDTSSGAGSNASGNCHSARRELASPTDDPGAWALTGSENWVAWTLVIQTAGAPASTVTDIYNITWAITPTWSETEVPDSSSGVILAAIGRVVSGFIGTVVDPEIPVIIDPGTPITNSGATFTPSSYEICQRSGRRAKRNALVRESYSGLWVLPEYYDPYHPQLDVRSRKNQLTRGAYNPDDTGAEVFLESTVSADDL